MPSVTAYRSCAFLARHIPLRYHSLISAVVSVAAIIGNRQRCILTRRNLERALGRPLTRLQAVCKVFSAFQWYARYYLESFALPSIAHTNIDARFGYQGFDAIERAAGTSKGPIIVLPHLGSWEWAARWLTLTPKIQVTAVVEKLEPPEVFEWFKGLRRQLNINVIAADKSAFSKTVHAMSQGHVVCLVSDRDITGHGVPVTFFGERTKLPAGPAILALRTGAPLIPVAVYWRNREHHAIALPPLDTTRKAKFKSDTIRVVQEYADALEYLIRLAPEQWHMMSPNWPSDYDALTLSTPTHLQGI